MKIEADDEKILNMCSHFDEFLIEFGENYELEFLELLAVTLGRASRMAIEYGHQEELKVLLMNALNSAEHKNNNVH